MSNRYTIDSPDVELTESLRISFRMAAEKMEQFLEGLHTEFTMRKEPEGFHVLIQYKLCGGESIQANSTHRDAYKAINDAQKKLVKRARRVQEKRRDQKRRAPSTSEVFEPESELEGKSDMGDHIEEDEAA